MDLLRVLEACARHFLFVYILTVVHALDVKPTLSCTYDTGFICQDLPILNSCTEKSLACSSGFTNKYISEDNAAITYTINNTSPNQPAARLMVEMGGNYRNLLESYFLVGRKIFVIGFRSCTSDPEKVCYISHDLPGHNSFDSDDWIRNILPTGGMNHTIQFGDQCTFFGCFKYCNRDEIPLCQRLYGNLKEQNITILATCSNELDSIENGSVSYSQSQTQQGQYLQHTTATITCDEGYTVSDDIVSCQNNGTWSSIPSCEILDCGPPPIPRNTVQISISSQNATSYNSIITATYKCKEGYLPPGNMPGNIAMSRTCNSDGNWSDNVTIECFLDCGPPPIPRNAAPISISSQNATSYTSIITATYECKEGYLPPGNMPGNIAMSRTCNSDGNWSDNATIECLECNQVASCGKEEECRVTNGTAICIPDTCLFTDCHLLKVIIPVSMVGLVLLVIIVVTTVIYRRYQNYQNDEVRKYKYIFQWQARREVLDPSYVPVDVQPNKSIPLALSFDGLSNYENFFDSPSEGHHYTQMPGCGGMFELLETNSALDADIDKDERTVEKGFETVTDVDIDDGFPKHSSAVSFCFNDSSDAYVCSNEQDIEMDVIIDHSSPSKNERSSVSFHFNDSSDAYVHNDEQDIEIKATEMELPNLPCNLPAGPSAYVHNDEQANETEAVGYVESTEMELPSLSFKYPEVPAEPYLNHDAVVAADEGETVITSLYINEYLNSVSGSSRDINFSTTSSSRDLPTDVSLAFELVDGATTASPLPPSSTPSPELTTTTRSASPPAVTFAITTPDVSTPEEDTPPYISFELLQPHHHPIPNFKEKWSDPTSISSGYLSEEVVKSDSTPLKNHKPVPNQSCQHDISPSKIRDLRGGGYDGVM